MNEHEAPLQDPNKSRKFSITDVQTSLEKREFYRLLEFPFKERRISVFVSIFSELPNYSVPQGQEIPAEEKKYICVLRIYDENNNRLGNIRGTVINNGLVHISVSTKNFGVRSKEGIPHLKGVVSESICQMLMNKVFEVWYSSSHLMPDGQKMYENIAEQLRKRAPNIEIFPEDNSYDNDGESKRWKFVSN